MRAKCIAHPNIALVKYWGKAEEDQIIPIHGSVSVTLDFGQTETIITENLEGKTTFKLNGETTSLTKRLQKAIDIFSVYSEKPLYINIDSVNSFPTAAGFASSASGAAAFVGALAAFVGQTDSPIEYWREKGLDLSSVARQVSGSGCRSIYGGFVEWTPGSLESPEKSIAIQIKDENYWNEFTVFSVILSSSKKEVLSTVGMQQTLKTVPWIQWRASEVVPERVRASKKLIEERKFAELSEIIIRESNELHANCLATYPPIKYMNDASFQIIQFVNMLNERGQIAAYSFDAGPNPFVFTTSKYENEIETSLRNLPNVISVTKAKPASGIVAFFASD